MEGQGPQVWTYQAVAAVMRAAKLMKRFLELRALSMGVDIFADGELKYLGRYLMAFFAIRELDC